MGHLLDGDFEKMLGRRKRNALLDGIAQGLIKAGSGGAGLLSGFAQAAQAGVQGREGALGEIPEIMRLREQQDASRARKARGAQYSRLLGGYDPESGITYETGRQGVPGEGENSPLLAGVTPPQRSALLSVPPEQGLGLLAGKAFEGAEPRTNVLNPEEAASLGLPAGGVYQQGPKGRVNAVTRPPTTAKPPVPLAILRKLEAANIDPQSEEGQKFIRADLAGQQISFEQGADGSVSVRVGRGVGDGPGLQKKTVGDIEAKLLGATEGLARLQTIASKFKPEYQEIPTRLGVAWSGLKARFGQGNVSTEDRQAATEFADYQRDAISNINLYIKEITGAQMSEAEAARLRLAVPDPGEGVFGGDDPIKFKAKLDSSMRDLERASVRYAYYLQQGITDVGEMAKRTPLDGMQVAVNPETGERIMEVDGQWLPI